MKIFNRWGAPLFETDDINKGWDGKFMNKEVPEGAYVNVITYDINENDILIKKNKSGIVTLIR